jgi:hypothetical protein
VICTLESLIVFHKIYKLGWATWKGATDGDGAADQFRTVGYVHLCQHEAGTVGSDSLLKSGHDDEVRVSA